MREERRKTVFHPVAGWNLEHTEWRQVLSTFKYPIDMDHQGIEGYGTAVK